MTEHNFPPACLVRDWTLIFAQDREVPKFIKAQYSWAKEEAAASYGDDPPETPAWVEDEQSGNPLLTALPLHPFETATLVDVVDGMGVYAVLRYPGVDSEGVVGQRVYDFAIVAPKALEKGVAIPDKIARPGEQTCWPVYACRIRESRLRKEAPKAWEHIVKCARRASGKSTDSRG